MTLPEPNPELLRSLGRLARGLSALFWGLPTALLVCVYTAHSEWLEWYAVIPPILATGWLTLGLSQMAHFQPQERVWIEALDRARLLSLIVVGLSPFLYWWNRAPAEQHYFAAVLLLCGSGLLFLAALNLVLRRLSAMLPDETLRLETDQFTALNRGLLFGTVATLGAYFVLREIPDPPPNISYLLMAFERVWLWLGILLILLPLAMTMALLWKTKQVILDSVFNRPGG